MPTQEIHRVPDAIIQAIRAYGGCRLARSNDMADQHYANAIELIGSALAAVPTQAIHQGKHEAFESQFAVPHGCRNFTRDEGGYVVRQIESMWQAWLAGRASLAAIPAPDDLVLRITTAYEQGFGHGIENRCLPNPYALMTPEWKAWDTGFAKGLARAPRAPSAPLPPVPGLTQHDFDRAADRGLAKWWDGVGGTEAGFIAAECFALHQSALSGPAPVPELTDALREALESIRQYGSDTLSGRTDGPNDRDWQRAAVAEMTRRARTALSLPKPEAAEPAPIDMVLHCPKCGKQHIDKRDAPLSADWDDAEAWTNPPHRGSHRER